MVYRTASPENKAKAAAYQREWRAKNPERWKEIVSPARKRWKAENRDEHREAQREHRYTVRQEILVLIGGSLRCKICGYKRDWRALQIDHINGGGKHDRDTFRGNANLWSLRKKLMNHQFLAEALKKYQVLCANCNRIKCYTHNEHAKKLIGLER